MDKIDILIIDDDVASQSALRQVLDTEGWRVHIASAAGQAMQALATGNWTLVIANISIAGFSGPLYSTLKELALASTQESANVSLRVLFLVPEHADAQARALLETQRLPYVVKPFHLHDFLERVSDLLMETGTISAPIRRVRQEGKAAGRRDSKIAREAATGQGVGRNTGMFANYADYSMTEEEIAEYEKQETAETERKKKKKLNSDKL